MGLSQEQLDEARYTALHFAVELHKANCNSVTSDVLNTADYFYDFLTTDPDEVSDQ